MKKKNGFTLIELVIVLAVLAIIALIAIPNFNKVRTDSQEKADKQTMEVIKNVTNMSIANQDMSVLTEIDLEITPGGTPVVSGDTVDVANVVEWSTNGLSNYTTALKEVKVPQQKNKTAYTVKIKTTSGIEEIEVGLK